MSDKLGEKKRVLIADPDLELVKKLGTALQAKGFDVLAAKDGSKALESSILKTPDIVLIAEHCPLIDAKRFSGILRANPRTENTPLLVLSDGDAPTDSYGYLDGHLQKPLNIDEVVGQIQSIAHKLDAAQSVRSEGAIVGRLAQISLVDLLQIFTMNRKSGRLSLKLEQLNGEVSLSEGFIISARCGDANGLKGLYRLLERHEGDFAFTPGAAVRDAAVLGDTNMLVLEGMRQLDELIPLKSELPAVDAVIERVPGGEPGEAAHPLTEQILQVLSEPRLLSDLFALEPATDFELAQALYNLLKARLIRVSTQPQGLASLRSPLLPEALVLVLRTYLHRHASPSVSASRPRVLILTDDDRRLTNMSNALRGLNEFVPETRGAARYGYGSLGFLPVAHDLGFEMVALPTRIDLLPAAIPLSMGALGVICLSGTSNDPDGLIAYKENMVGRLGVPWLEVTLEPAQADKESEADPRAVRGMIAALCRSLSNLH